MRHEYIEENQIVDRYLMEQLSDQEREAFEDHYLHCARCQDDLEAARALRGGLKAAAGRGWAQTPSELEGGWGSRRRPRPLWTLAAVAVLAALLLLPPIYLFLQMNELDSQLQQARSDLRESRDTAEQRAQQVGRLSQELQALQSQLGQEEGRLQQQLQQERQARQQLAADLQRMGRPQINTPVIPLDALRSAPSEGSATVVRPADDSSWVVLSLLLDRTGFAGYRVQLRQVDEVAWQSDGLRPNYRDELVLNLPVDMLREGDYQLHVHGLREDGSYRPLGRYAFTFKP
ncbi:MAG TPA: hypothetical protein VLV83_11675 [Acidobacteriota bacterium]|nr:hypothetical protein [Acidobacteriota bacterium]